MPGEPEDLLLVGPIIMGIPIILAIMRYRKILKH
jgi:hypothetical protein